MIRKNIGSKIGQAAGMVVSPWLYLGALGLRKDGLRKVAMSSDPLNLRAIDSFSDGDRDKRHITDRLRLATMLAARLPLADAEMLIKHVGHSHSQFCQDLLAMLVSDGKQGGFFVEVGVGDGLYLSNSAMLEQQFGWKGVLCEPNRTFQQIIPQNRSAILEKRAAFNRSGEILKFLAESSSGELSRLVDASGSDMHQRAGETYDVETVTLNDALAQHNAPETIDYISIDTEGSEIAVLKGLDLNRWKVNLFTIEHNHDAPRRAEFAAMLEPHGFVRVLSEISGVDDWYVHQTRCAAFLARLG